MPEASPVKPPALTDAAKPKVERSGGGSAFGRITQHLPSGQQLGKFLKNLLWVAPLTLLIWVYAEREQNVIVQMPAFPIAFKTTAVDRVVFLRLPQDRNVVVDLSGPRAKIDAIRELLVPKAEAPSGIQLLIDAQIGDGPQQLNAVKLLNDHPLFKNNGITVKACQPPYLTVDIDRIDERPAVVQLARDANHGAEISLVGFEPERVTIRAAASLLAKHQPDRTKPLVVHADVSNRNELKTRTGKVELSSVDLRWDEKEKENVTINPGHVRATFNVAPAKVTPQSIAIFKETPVELERDYTITYASTINNVTIFGPKETIEKIEANPSLVRGRIAILDPSVSGKTSGTSEVKFDLPAGCWFSTEEPYKEWKWELVRR